MIRYTLFRALDPDDRYPKSPLPLKVSEIVYDLPLPTDVANAFVNLLSDKGPFRRVDKYCEPGSFDEIRNNPKSFGSASGYPNYAEAEMRVSSRNGDWTMTHVLLQAAANKIAAAEISRFALEGKFRPSVAEWIKENSIFFQHGGGFEIARGTFYYAADVGESDETDSEGRDDAPKEIEVESQAPQLSMFRDMLERSPAALEPGWPIMPR